MTIFLTVAPSLQQRRLAAKGDFQHNCPLPPSIHQNALPRRSQKHSEVSMNVLRRVPLGPARFNTVLIIAGGSILDYVGDAFVNAANEGCTGGFGVDEQVLRSILLWI